MRIYMPSRGTLKKSKKQLHPICAAVKRIREASGLSQERFGRSLDLAVMTISRFENGHQIPSDLEVLTGLHNAAAKLGLEQERDLFAEILTDRSRYRDKIIVPLEHSPVLWRWMQVVRVAMLIEPKRMGAIESAITAVVNPKAISLVDEVLRGSNPVLMFLDPDFWPQKESELTARANQVALERITREEK